MKDGNPEEQAKNLKYSTGINIFPFSYRGGCC
jgi:hypothetical protein